MKFKILSSLLLLISISACLKDDAKLKIVSNTIPADLKDDWTISSPEIENFDLAKLSKATAMFFDENTLVTSRALLIARNGKLVQESYCRDLNDRDELQNIKSITKSITSMMVGIGIKDNLIDSNLNRTVFSYLPDKFDDQLEKRTITIEQCLRMTTGLEDPVYTNGAELYNGADHLSTCLGVKLEFTPGYVYNYNNANANILAGILKKESNEQFERFTQNRFLDKLNIADTHWVRWGDGEVNAAYDLWLLPRDMLKIGQFALQNGSWKGEQLLPIDWLTLSTQAYEHGGLDDYGYHWWVDHNQNGYYAYGQGGQCIYILPNKNLVIVHLSGTLASEDEKLQVPLLFDLIIEAAN